MGIHELERGRVFRSGGACTACLQVRSTVVLGDHRSEWKRSYLAHSVRFGSRIRDGHCRPGSLFAVEIGHRHVERYAIIL